MGSIIMKKIFLFIIIASSFLYGMQQVRVQDIITDEILLKKEYISIDKNELKSFNKEFNENINYFRRTKQIDSFKITVGDKQYVFYPLAYLDNDKIIYRWTFNLEIKK